MILNSFDIGSLWVALIGVGGTIIGSLLGWLLSRKSKRKLDINITELKMFDDRYQFDREKNQEVLDQIKILIKGTIYNPSDIIKLIADPRLVAMRQKGDVAFSCVLGDYEQQASFMGRFVGYEIVELEHFSPKMAYKIKFVVYLNKENVQLAQTVSKFSISYKNEKGKTIKTPVICRINFKDIPLSKPKTQIEPLINIDGEN